MRYCFLVAILFLGMSRVSAGGEADDVARKELRRMQGMWDVMECWVDGYRMLNVPKDRCDIAGPNILSYRCYRTYQRLGEWHYFAIDPSTEPKQIYLVDRSVPPTETLPLSKPREYPKKWGLKGIYRLTDDTLELYYANYSAGARPKAIPRLANRKGYDYLFLKRRPKPKFNPGDKVDPNLEIDWMQEETHIDRQPGNKNRVPGSSGEQIP